MTGGSRHPGNLSKSLMIQSAAGAAHVYLIIVRVSANEIDPRHAQSSGVTSSAAVSHHYTPLRFHLD